MKQICAQNNNLCGQQSVVELNEVPESKTDYFLVFSEEFDSNSFNQKYWNVITGRSRDFSLEYQQEFLSKNQVYIRDGSLIIQADRYNAPKLLKYNYNGDSLARLFRYTSAEIQTNRFFKYGYYEIRCQIPNGIGTWPAFWFFGGKSYNEIDVFEFTESTSLIGTNLHIEKPGWDCPFTILSPVDLSNEYHTYGLLYTPTAIIWYLDGKVIRKHFKYQLISNGYDKSATELNMKSKYLETHKFPSAYMQIVINLALLKNIPSNTEFPQLFRIDYLRFYAPKKCHIGSFTIDSNFVIDSSIYNSIVAEKIIIKNVEFDYRTQIMLICDSIIIDKTTKINEGARVDYKITDNVCAQKITIHEPAPEKPKSIVELDVRFFLTKTHLCIINNTHNKISEILIYNLAGNIIVKQACDLNYKQMIYIEKPVSTNSDIYVIRYKFANIEGSKTIKMYIK